MSKYWAEFYRGSRSVLGSDGTAFFDGRRSRRTASEEARAIAMKRGFDGYRLGAGPLRDLHYVTPIREVNPDTSRGQVVGRERQAERRGRTRVAKYEGDDLYSWALFLDGRPVYTGMSRNEARWRRENFISTGDL